jgi:chromosome segregation ATPase
VFRELYKFLISLHLAMKRTLFIPLALSFAAISQTPAHAQVSLKAGGSVKVETASGSAPGASTTSGLQDNIKGLQDSIKKATDRLQNAGKSSEEKMKELDGLAQTVEVALKEVSANGGLYSELQKSISATEARAKAYHDKSIDPNISAETQLKYRNLENRLSGAREKLYKSQMAMDAQRTDLEKKLRDVKENRNLVSDMLAANDLEEANKAVLDVVKNMAAVNESFDGLLKNMVSVGVAEKAQ